MKSEDKIKEWLHIGLSIVWIIGMVTSIVMEIMGIPMSVYTCCMTIVVTIMLNNRNKD